MHTQSYLRLSRTIACLTFATLGLLLPACKKAAAPDKPVALTTDEQKMSYGIGYSIAKDVSSQDTFKVDQAALKAGMADGLAGTPTRLTEAEIQAAFQAVNQRRMAAANEAAGKALAAEASFLEKNKARPGVVVTASGLQYEVLKPGSGPMAQPSNTVVVHYRGTLTDGTEFDTSLGGQPAEFEVTGVIKAWTEALQLMPVGAKLKLYVPSGLGYGPRARPKIPANSTLIFEVELLAIK